MHALRFGVFELDPNSGELRRNGLKIRLPEQSFQILKPLLSRPGDVVTRDELRHVLWASDTFVDFEVGLNSAVRKLREALDDSAENPRFVETVPRRGYRFIASVAGLVSDPPESEPLLEPAAEALPERASSPVSAGWDRHTRRWSDSHLLLLAMGGWRQGLAARSRVDRAQYVLEGSDPVAHQAATFCRGSRCLRTRATARSSR